MEHMPNLLSWIMISLFCSGDSCSVRSVCTTAPALALAASDTALSARLRGVPAGLPPGVLVGVLLIKCTGVPTGVPFGVPLGVAIGDATLVLIVSIVSLRRSFERIVLLKPHCRLYKDRNQPNTKEKSK